MGDDTTISFEDANPGALVMMGGAALGLAGFCVAALGVQFMVLIPVSGWVAPIPYMLLLLGMSALALGGWITRGNAVAAWLGLVVTMATAILVVSWTIFTAVNGLFSLLSIVSTLAIGLALLAVPVAIPGAMRATRVRRALYA
jgi:hypothetical protein